MPSPCAHCSISLQAEPGFHKASIRLATCHMRVGDADAARACLAADAALAAHADVAAKLQEVEAHTALLTAVRLRTTLPIHAAKPMLPCVKPGCRDNAPFLKSLTCLRLLYIDSMSCIGMSLQVGLEQDFLGAQQG